MPNQFYSAFKETNETGPLQHGKKAPDVLDTSSRKNQRGGWSPESALGRSKGGGRISTSKSQSGGEKRNSTNKSESGEGWRCSTKKGGSYG